jgi:hypothetical protein
LRIEVFDLKEQDGAELFGAGESYDRGTVSHAYQARLKLAARADHPSGTSSPLVLHINPTTARIGVESGAWLTISEPVLDVVAQFWRFLAIDRVLDELTDWARGDLKQNSVISLLHWHRSRELRAHRRTLQALLLDLPDFEVYLTNARARISPRRWIRIYQALAVQLGLDRHRRAIDERVEVVEAVLDSLADSLNHLQALVFQLVLELAIVSLLLLDVGLYLRDSLIR